MDKIGLWFLLSCKRQLKRPAFLILLILLPLASLGIRQLEQKEDEGISIALLAEGDGLPASLAKALVDNPGTFSFYLCDSLEQLKEDVITRKAECGYVFPADFEELLEQKQWKRSAQLYLAPSTVADALSTELVFSRLMEIYGKKLLKGYMQSDSIFAGLDGEVKWAEMEELYDKYYQNGSTFSFAFQTTSDMVSEKPVLEEAKGVTFPVRGLAAVFVFVVGLFSGAMLLTDEKKGLFRPLCHRQKVWCSLASCGGPVFLAVCSALAALAVSGSIESLGMEIGVMAIYGLAVLFVSYLVCRILPNDVVVCSLIPFLAMGSLILCPVFLDVRIFLPQAEGLGKFFLPYYYITFFK